MRSTIGRQMRSNAMYQDGTMGKTKIGKFLHDVGATTLKAVVQPFASFTKYSNPANDTKHIFNPVMQTKVAATIDKGVNILNTVGHVAGKAFTSAVTEGLINIKTPKSPTTPIVPGAGAPGSGPVPGNLNTNSTTPVEALGRNKLYRKLTFDINSLIQYIPK